MSPGLSTSKWNARNRNCISAAYFVDSGHPERINGSLKNAHMVFAINELHSELNGTQLLSPARVSSRGSNKAAVDPQ